MAKSQRHTPFLTRRTLIGGGGIAAGARLFPARATTTGYGIPRVSLPDFPNGDAFAGSGPGAIWAQLLTMSSLLHLSPEGSIRGGLALSWSLSADRTQLDLEIRIDALFSDGARILAEDVRASVDDARNRYFGTPEAWRWDHLESVELTPEGAIRLNLTEPDASIPALLASHLIPIYPAEWLARGWDREAGPFPPASGCYTMEASSADRLRFGRNDGFYQVGRPRLAGIVCNAPVDIFARTTELVTNGVDLLIDVPLLDVPLLREDPGVMLAGGTTNQLCLLTANIRSEAVADSRLRRLLSSAIDREDLVRTATAGEAVPASTLIPVDHWAGLDAAIGLADPDDVRAELAALGNPPGIELRLVADEADAALANACVLLQEQLAWAGIALTLDFLADREMEQELAGDAWDVAIHNTPYWSDPHELIRSLFVSGAKPNAGGYRNHRIDYLAGLASRAHGNEIRGRLYRTIQEIVQDEVPVIPLFFPNYYDAMLAKLQDYPYYPPMSVLAMRQATMSRPEPAGLP